MTATQQINTELRPNVDRLDVRRQNQSLAVFCTSHVAEVLAGNDALDAPLSCSPVYVHVVVWVKDGVEHTSECTSCTSQEDVDALADALKAAIVAAGGTVISG